MQHITKKTINDSFVEITPDDGYMLYNRVTQTMFSEAIVKNENVKDFYAIPMNE